MVGFQQSTEALDTDDFTLMTFVLRLDDLAEALVNPLDSRDERSKGKRLQEP